MLQCTSSNLEVLLISIMVLCNLPTCLGYQIKSVDKNGLLAVNQLLTILLPLVSKYVMMILCNLVSYELLQDHFSSIWLDEWYQSGMQGTSYNDSMQFGIKGWLQICNFGHWRAAAIVNHRFTVKSALLTLCNLSSCETSYPLFVG